MVRYPNHAAYTLETRMAKSPETVAAFLNNLDSKLNALARRGTCVAAVTELMSSL